MWMVGFSITFEWLEPLILCDPTWSGTRQPLSRITDMIWEAQGPISSHLASLCRKSDGGGAWASEALPNTALRGCTESPAVEQSMGFAGVKLCGWAVHRTFFWGACLCKSFPGQGLGQHSCNTDCPKHKRTMDHELMSPQSLRATLIYDRAGWALPAQPSEDNDGFTSTGQARPSHHVAVLRLWLLKNVESLGVGCGLSVCGCLCEASRL